MNLSLSFAAVVLGIDVALAEDSSPTSPTMYPTPLLSTGSDGSSPTPTYFPTTLPTLETDFFQGFEEHSFSFAGEDNPVWLTTNENDPDLVWTRTEEEAIGSFSLKSPVLDNEMKTPSSAKLTLILPDNTGGALHFSVKAGSKMPFDLFEYSVNGFTRGSLINPMSEFEEIVVQLEQLEAGAHVIDFVYKFNPLNLLAAGFPPESFPERTGFVYVDNVYFVPRSSPVTPTGQPTLPPTPAPTAPILKPTNFPTVSRAPSSCTGSTLDWIDSYGDGCDWYEANDSPGCPLFGNDCLSGVDCDGNMGVANDNCCYCMSTGAPAVPTPKPTRAPVDPRCNVEDLSMVGDGMCNNYIAGYNTEECEWDGGDCVVDGYPDCRVNSPSVIGDNTCNGEEYNTEECGWDGGDCIEFNLSYPNCNVQSPYRIGNGFCNDDDEGYNTEDCMWDGGDCEPPSTTIATPTQALEEITCDSVVIDSTIGLEPVSMSTCFTSDGSGGAKLYKLVGTGEMTTLSTCGEGTDYDTKIRVYQKEALEDLCITGNDDSCGLSSTVEFVAESGVEYNVLVDGYSSGQGTYELSVTCNGVFV